MAFTRPTTTAGVARLLLVRALAAVLLRARGATPLPQLAVVTPCHRPHLPEWTRLVESIARSLPEPAEPRCAFAPPSHLTVVTDEAERGVFERVLRRVGAGTPWSLGRIVRGAALAERFAVRTLHGALARAGAAPPPEPALLDALNSSSKHWVQSLKKVYGCLSTAAHSCLLLDAESLVLRNNLCHAASVYERRGRHVLITPWPELGPTKWLTHGKVAAGIKISQRSVPGLHRSVRNGLDLDPGFRTPSFYAMQSYHWLLRRSEVGAFAKVGVRTHQGLVPMLAAATQSKLATKLFAVEDAFYRFAWMRPRWNYTYVDARALAIGAVGKAAWEELSAMTTPYGVLEALGCAEKLARRRRLAPPDRARHVLPIARAVYERTGVRFARCGPTDGGRAAWAALEAVLDVCTSNTNLEQGRAYACVDDGRPCDWRKRPGQGNESC